MWQAQRGAYALSRNHLVFPRDYHPFVFLSNIRAGAANSELRMALARRRADGAVITPERPLLEYDM